jgi:hypothetical protein
MSCGYDLRGLSENRCPECGQAFDPADPPAADVPWLHRKEIGAWRAFWETVVMVLAHPRRLGAQVHRDVVIDPGETAGFRHLCSGIAAASFALWLGIVLWNVQAGEPRWVVVAVAMSSIPGVLLFVYFAGVPIDQTRLGTAADQSHFMRLHEFTSAALVLWPIVPLTQLLAFGLAGADAAVICALVAAGLVMVGWIVSMLGYQVFAANRNGDWFATNFVLVLIMWAIVGAFCSLMSSLLAAGVYSLMHALLGA